MGDQQHWLITGASSGIGRLAAERLQQKGHRLTVICRSQQRAEQTLSWINGTAGCCWRIWPILTRWKPLDES